MKLFISSLSNESSQDWVLPANSVRLFGLEGQSQIQGANPMTDLDPSQYTPNSFADAQVFSATNNAIENVEVGVNNRNKAYEEKFSPFPYLATKASSYFEVPVYVAKHALGGTNIDAHLYSAPDPFVYEYFRNTQLRRMVNMMRLSGQRIFYYSLYGQGWSDGGTQERIDAYEGKLLELIAQRRSDMGADMPMILLETIRDGTIRDQIADIQVAVAANDPLTEIIRTTDLTDKGDGIHWDPPSCATIVDRFYTIVKTVIPIEITEDMQSLPF